MVFLRHLPFLLTLFLTTLALDASFKEWTITSPKKTLSLKEAPKIAPSTLDRPTARFSRLKRVSTASIAKRSALSALSRTSHLHLKDDRGLNITSLGDSSMVYAIDCTWDGIPLSLIFDTGSSDTWAIDKNFECEDAEGGTDDQGACAFGGPGIKGFSGGPVESIHFYLQYGDGETVWGPMGRSNITCGGLTVPRQQVGLANHTAWVGDNVTVGILGLAYPALTSAYLGDIGDEKMWDAIEYTPFLTSAISQGMNPTFSVAISKNSSDGILAWGGLPPVPYDRTKNATTDLLIANLINTDHTAWEYSFYTIVPDGIKWGTTSDTAKYPYVVDTGTTMMYLPPPLVESIAAAFVPKAVYLYQWGGYFVDCNAMPPLISVTISGVDFRINPADLIYKDMVDPMTGYCGIGIASGEAGPYILGDVFLQSVVAVFDIGSAEMRFYGR